MLAHWYAEVVYIDIVVKTLVRSAINIPTSNPYIILPSTLQNNRKSARRIKAKSRKNAGEFSYHYYHRSCNEKNKILGGRLHHFGHRSGMYNNLNITECANHGIV